MDWVVLTALAISFRAIFSITSKLYSKNIDASSATLSLISTALAGVISLIASPFMGGISFVGITHYWFLLMVMILSRSVGMILFYMGLKHLDSGTSQIVFSSILIWGALLSTIFLGSVFSLVQVFGMLIMLGAILLVQYKKTQININKGITYTLIAAFFLAMFQVASADLSKNIPVSAYLILGYFGPTILMALFYSKVVKRDFIKLKSQALPTLYRAFLASGASMLYFIFSYYAYKYSPDSGVVVVLLASQVIFSVILGIVLLKEKENLLKKLAAGVLAVVSGILIQT